MSFKTKSGKKNDMSGIKKVLSKNDDVENKKRDPFLLRKKFVWIKDDWDSETRLENLQKKSGFGLDRCFPFCRFSSKFLLCILW